MTESSLHPIIGVSPAIQRAKALMERFAPTSLPILLLGATGTGKELFAQHIHERSSRRGALIDLNCGTLPTEIADSLLFGHRRGAFTGAVESVDGHIQRAHEGTLFLDEVGHLAVPVQVKLLRVLERGEIQPIGSGHKRRVDVRIVSAAQEDTPDRVESRDFRLDLFQRLAGVIIDLPALHDRPEDIVPLAKHFAGLRGHVLDPGSLTILEDHAWPGNVRELQLTIERASCLIDNGILAPGAIQDAIHLGIPQRQTEDRQRDPVRRASERRRNKPRRSWDELVRLCHEHGGNSERVAASLGIGRSALYDNLRAVGISLRSFRKSGDQPEFRQRLAGIPE